MIAIKIMAAKVATSAPALIQDIQVLMNLAILGTMTIRLTAIAPLIAAEALVVMAAQISS